MSSQVAEIAGEMLMAWSWMAWSWMACNEWTIRFSLRARYYDDVYPDWGEVKDGSHISTLTNKLNIF